MTKRPPSNRRTSPRRTPSSSSPSKNNDTSDTRGYRPGVGIVLFNRDGRVFVGERLDNPGAWQMPQGGIDDNEDPEVAVFREMEEEVGTRKARIIGTMEDWVTYDIPEKTAKRLWGGKYRGQRQKWLALEFLGDDGDIDIEAFEHPEFGQWKWVPLPELLDYAVPFKRDIYRRVIEEFTPLAKKFSARKGR